MTKYDLNEIWSILRLDLESLEKETSSGFWDVWIRIKKIEFTLLQMLEVIRMKPDPVKEERVSIEDSYWPEEDIRKACEQSMEDK